MRIPAAGSSELREIAVGGISAGRAVLTVLPRIEALLDHAERTIAQLEVVVARLDNTETEVRRVVADTEATQKRADSFVRQVADRVGQSQIEKFATAIHDIPLIARQLEQRVVPALDALRN